MPHDLPSSLATSDAGASDVYSQLGSPLARNSLSRASFRQNQSPFSSLLPRAGSMYSLNRESASSRRGSIVPSALQPEIEEGFGSYRASLPGLRNRLYDKPDLRNDSNLSDFIPHSRSDVQTPQTRPADPFSSSRVIDPQSPRPLNQNSVASPRRQSFAFSFPQIQIDIAGPSPLHFDFGHPQSPTSANRHDGEYSDEHILNKNYRVELPHKHVTEFLDLDTNENQVWQRMTEGKSLVKVSQEDFVMWIITIIAGLCMGVLAALMHYAMQRLGNWKLNIMEELMESNSSLWASLGVFCISNMVCVMIASVVTMFTPCSTGSGIPEIKCYFNGIVVPGLFDWGTLICKSIGTVMSNVSHLPVGSGAPQIHSGAIIAAMLPILPVKAFRHLRTDVKRRTFAMIGAGMGVSAAFGAPIGGVLWVLEVSCAQFYPGSMWKVYTGAMVCAFTMNVLSSGFGGSWGALGYSGLYKFGSFSMGQNYFQTYEFPMFFVIAVFGGIFGAVFVEATLRIGKLRGRLVPRTKKWRRLVEAVMVAFIVNLIMFFVMDAMPTCRPLEPISIADRKYLKRLNCREDEYSEVGTLLFDTGSTILQLIFHRPEHLSIMSLLICGLVYGTLCCFTFGIAIPSGTFAPSIIMGGTVGASFGLFVQKHIYTDANPGFYGLIGGAAFVGGCIRSNIAFTVIFLEAANNASFAVPIMAVMTVAKWVGGLFTQSLYDAHVRARNLPYIDIVTMEDSLIQEDVSQIMTPDPISFPMIPTVRTVIHALKMTNVSGFPVIHDAKGQYGKQSDGIILRSELLILLYYKPFQQHINSQPPPLVTIDQFRAFYPSHPTWEQIQISSSEMDLLLDLSPYINAMPQSVPEHYSVKRLVILFRKLGLRHVLVHDIDTYEIRGIVTRQDLLHILQAEAERKSISMWSRLRALCR